MATTTPNIGLTLTPQNGGSKTFQTFRTELAGDGATSNMMLIDAAIGELQSGKYAKPTGGIPASDLASSVRASLALADSSLQTAPVTSVNGQTGAVTLTIPDVSGKLDINQGAANAGKVMTVDSSGNIVPVTPGGGGDPVQITIGDVDGLQTALNGKEPIITAGATTQYLRGDKTWQTLNKSAVGLGYVPNVTTNNQTPTYSAASTRTNLTSGETLATALGKIKKWFTDLKTVAFSGSYEDLSDTPTVPTKMSDLVNDSGYITGADVPEGSAASTTTPKMDGTAAVGSETAFARGDHVHPTDTSRASASPTYSTPSSRTALTSGEPLSTALGKIQKWLADLGTLAFKSSVSKTDLEASVQESLDNADSALQEHQSLAAYRTAAAQDVIDAGKQATLTAGENITIVNNVISASGGGGSGDEMTIFTMGTATYAEVKAAYDAGKDIVVHYAPSNDYMRLARYAADVDGGTLYFYGWASNTLRYTSISSTNGWDYTSPNSMIPMSAMALSTKGDILIRNNHAATRLGIGTEGQVLTVVNGMPAWQTLETYDGDVEYLTAYAGGVH